MGLLFAAGAWASPALGGEVKAMDEARDVKSSGEPEPSFAAAAKIHGTITVDFDKVTIAELLKLVKAVEKVDGVIHIVSSSAPAGEPAMIVNGSHRTLTVSNLESPGTPRLAVAASPRLEAPRIQQVRRSGAAALPDALPFPRLAALRRLIGMAEPVDDIALHRTTPPKVDAVAPRGESSMGKGEVPSQREAAARPLAIERVTAAPLGLTAGGRFDALASGDPLPGGSIRSPWPVATTSAPVSARSRDPQLTRADHAVRPATNSRSETCVVDGETFEDLAVRFYGDDRYAWALWWANRDRIAWPDALSPGKPIVIPPLGGLDPKMVMTESSASVAGSPPKRPDRRRDSGVVRASHAEPSPTPAPEAIEPGGFAVHVVRPEDTLRMIARERCGDERKALEIIALNRDVLTAEGRPRVGQRLILPSAAASPVR